MKSSPLLIVALLALDALALVFVSRADVSADVGAILIVAVTLLTVISIAVLGFRARGSFHNRK